MNQPGQICDGKSPRDQLSKDVLSTGIAIGGRTYDLLALVEVQTVAWAETLVKRAEVINANLGEDDGQHFLKYQEEIPEVFRGKAFVFTDWRGPTMFTSAACLIWSHDGRWVQEWHSFARYFTSGHLVPRRK